MNKTNKIELFKIIGVGILTLLCIGISYLGHFVLNSHLFYAHLFYIPIIIGSLWWGYKSLFIPLILVLSLLITHYLSTDVSLPISSMLKIVMFFLISVLISFLSQKRKLHNISLHEEITKLELSQKALKESKLKFQTVANNIYDWEYWIDQNGKYVYVSPACEKITGYAPDHFISDSKLIFEIIHPEFKDKVSDHYLKERDDNHRLYSMEFIIIRADGKEKWIEHNCNPVFDNEGNFIGRRGNNRDITEFKNNETEINKLITNYNEIIELQDNCVAIYDVKNNGTDFIFTNFNKSAENLEGIKKKQIIGKNLLDVFPGSKEFGIYDVFKKVYKTGKPEFLPVSFYKDEKIQGWRENYIYKISSGQIVSIYKDVTEQKKSEEKIKRLAHTIESITESVSITNTSNNIIYVNQALLNLYGYSASELIGKTPDILRANQDEHLTKAIFANTKNEDWTGEVWNKKKDGTIFPIELTTSSIKDENGKTFALVGIGRDITKRKKDENLRNIMYNISQAVNSAESTKGFIGIVKDQIGTIIDTTNFFVALYDETKGTISAPFMSDEKDKYKTIPIEKSLTGYLIKQEAPLLLTKNKILELNKTGEIEIIGTMAEAWLGVPLKSNNKIFGAFVLQSYNDKDAFSQEDVKVLEFISSQISISIDRRKFIDDIKDALEKAQQSDKLKSAFLTNLSHEIRTPMNGIMGFVNLLKNPDLKGEKKEVYIDMIQKSSSRMLNIITDIVSLSKIDSGLIELNNSKTNINTQIDSIYHFFKPETDEKGLQLSFQTSLPTNTANIITDKEKLNHILTKLVNNAIKYTNEGYIQIGYVKKDTYFEFFVKDSGIGISPDKQEQIFDRFVQADISETRAYEGAGIGLSITKSYVEMLGGKIWLESNKKNLHDSKEIGSIFYFTIPLIVDKSEETETTIPKREQARNINILIAEDDETSKLLLSEMTEAYCQEILFAKNGSEAVEVCKNNQAIDLVLMDIRMPILNGYEASKQIREFNKDVVIIAQTAFSLPGDRELALKAGCNDYITKPISLEKISKIFSTYF